MFFQQPLALDHKHSIMRAQREFCAVLSQDRELKGKGEMLPEEVRKDSMHIILVPGDLEEGETITIFI